MLDDPRAYPLHDPSSWWARLGALPTSYAGPDGEMPGPHALHGSARGALWAPALRSWWGSPESAQTVFEINDAVIKRAGGEDNDADADALMSLRDGKRLTLGPSGVVRLPGDALAPHHWWMYLANATGRAALAEQAVGVLRHIADKAHPEHATPQNPAKSLAWALWNRVPLFVTNGNPALGPLVQGVHAEVAKALSIDAGPYPLLFASHALESQHALGDDLVAVILGELDRTSTVVEEVLRTRVSQVERLNAQADWIPTGLDPAVNALGTWYAWLWVASYLAQLTGVAPEDAKVYRLAQSSIAP
jgi:hypothetical protein